MQASSSSSQMHHLGDSESPRSRVNTVYDQYVRKFCDHDYDTINSVISDLECVLKKMRDTNVQCRDYCDKTGGKICVAGGIIDIDPVPYNENLQIIENINNLNTIAQEMKYKSSCLQGQIQRIFNLVFAYVPENDKPSILYLLCDKK